MGGEPDVYTLGVVQRITNVPPHVWEREGGYLRPVSQTDRRMHDRTGLHSDVDLRRWEPKQVAGLDELEALVH